MLCALSHWKFWTKNKNGAKAFTTLVAMQLYRISHSESQFPHCNKGSTIVLRSTSTCKTFDKSQNPWVWLRTHYFTIGLSVSIIVFATSHVFPHGALNCNWRLYLWQQMLMAFANSKIYWKITTLLTNLVFTDVFNLRGVRPATLQALFHSRRPFPLFFI
jgi:hypothetical protein